MTAEAAPERIAAVALRYGGLTLSVPAPGRHHHVLQRMARMGLARRIALGADQGFITDRGRYVTREEAWGIADAAGQIALRAGMPEGLLFSENLW